MAHNYSLYAIPAFYALSMSPHLYATSLIKRSNDGKWDNANPRSTTWADKLKKSVPADVYARYERAESAHRNGLENMPVFATCILMGNMARLPNETLNGVASTYLALRVVYTLVYINVSSARLAYARTGVFLCSAGVCVYLMIKAANVFSSGVLL